MIVSDIKPQLSWTNRTVGWQNVLLKHFSNKQAMKKVRDAAVSYRLGRKSKANWRRH